MKVHVVNHNSGNIRVHKVGCRDVAKDIRFSGSNWKMTVPDGDDVAKAVADDLNDSFGWFPGSDEPMPWDTNDVVVLPCVH